MREIDQSAAESLMLYYSFLSFLV